MIEREDGDAVVQLERIGIGSVVNQSHILEVTVQHAQVLHVHPLLRLETVLPVQSIIDIFAIGVQIIQHHVGVAWVGCREDYNLEILRQILENLPGVRPDVYACFDDFTGREFNRQLHVMRWGQAVIAVNQCLIEVEYHTFPV